MARPGGSISRRSARATVEAPWAHPVWHSYMLMAVHLRPLPGFPPPKINLTGATHEVMLYALDPEYTPRLDDVQKYLTPGNFHGQWIAESDAAATAKVEGCVNDILNGLLSPDTDHRRTWTELFSDSNIKPEWKGVPETMVGIAGDGAVVIVGTGKSAVELLTTVAAGPVPPKKEQH